MRTAFLLPGKGLPMTRAQIVMAIRDCWAETNMAAAFRRAAGIDPLPLDARNGRSPRKPHRRRSPSREYERLMRQRYGALDRG